ncbi:type VII toxin-antitoxin system HepT family RNase toxin [Parageobacillus toebii]|uniref:type VII toxin-antitoxin system HepT family RNase toxin n=1 Tax=Parageobacillus toebii TaxID=153151 RepID=UPI0035B51228
MNNDVILNKISVIERCIKRINEEYDNNPKNLQNYTKQDSIILNIQRACEASIDIAMHIVAEKKLGIPQTSRDAFELLYKNHIITESVMKKMKAMVGFRNIAVHDYQEINLQIVQMIVEKHLDDFREYAKQVLVQKNKES